MDHILSARLSINSPNYKSVDIGSGRCRLMNSIFDILGVKIGWILRLRLYKSESEVLGEFIVTVWPDSYHELLQPIESIHPPSIQVIIDTAVTTYNSVSSFHSLSLSSIDTFQAKILGAFPPRICRSIHINNKNGKNYLSSHFTGLPLCSGSIALIHLFNQISSSNDNRVQVSKVNGCEYGTVSSSTIIVHGNKSNSITRDMFIHVSSSEEIKPSSSTSPVNEILKRVVFPYCTLSLKENQSFSNLSSLVRGILLTGSPGNGKTYAVKAVQKLCRDICNIRIINISIPSLLASPDPCEAFRKELKDILVWITNVSDKSRSTEKSSDIISTPVSSSQTNNNHIESDLLLSTRQKSSPFSFKNIDFSSLISKSVCNNSPISDFKSSRKEKNDSICEIVFIVFDEIDSLGQSKKHSQKQIAIKHQICDLFEIFHTLAVRKEMNIFTPYHCIIATSNRPQDIDPCFRRGGRFEAEIQVITTKEDRYQLLNDLLSQLNQKLDDSNGGNLSIHDIMTLSTLFVDQTGGYNAADLVNIISETEREINIHLTSVSDSTSKEELLQLWIHSFEQSKSRISPSCLRGITVDHPKISYDDVVGYHQAKTMLKRILSFTDPTKKSIRQHFHVQHLGGALLHGPPGNSKTRLIMAAASSHHLPVITLSSADVYSPYVGDAEAEIRKAFAIARQGSPCILFLDELDALVTNRKSSSSLSSSNVESRVLATLLNEMDGISVSSENEVIVFAATNRIESIDAALLRKGRFHHLILIQPPNEEERLQLLEYFATKCQLQQDWKVFISKLTPGISGASIENICREAKLIEMKEIISTLSYTL